MLKLFKYLKKIEWFEIALSVLMIVGSVWLEIKLPSYMSEITKLLSSGGTTKQILEQGAYMLLCALGSAGLSVIIGFLVAKVSAGLATRLREMVFNKVQDFSSNEMNKFSIPSLLTRSTNDIVQVQNFVSMGLQVMFKAPILAIWAIVTILGKGWQWSVATAVAVAILLIMVVILITIVFPKFKKIQNLTDNLNNVSRENLTGVRVVRAFNAENYEEQKFENVNKTLTNSHLFVGKFMGILNPGMTLLMNGLSVSIYWIGAVLINNTADMIQKINLFGDMTVFLTYAMQVIMSFMMLTMIFIMLPRASVSANRINQVLNTKSSVIDGPGAKKTNLVGEVEFDNVSFKYPDAEEYVLKNISFKANKGETIAFIGSTGSGKSTLINLLPRFYDVTDGAVKIDGVNVKDYKLEELNNKIGYVSQKAVMFRGTIKDNIAYGKSENKIEEQDVVNAIEIAQGKDFVESMQEGYNSNLNQEGTNISGGQKQRLSIARAIAKKPEILIFDDSFSALDYATDKKLRATIKEKIANTTIFIVAQRIGTIKEADKIVVLENGNAVGIGTHKELMKTCQVYKEIALSQLSKEELK